MAYAWELPLGKRNEALDTEVYAYAALHLVGIGDYEGTVKQIIGAPVVKKVEREAKVVKINPFTDDL
jgi:phage terminase large subunit GpA-like protein